MSALPTLVYNGKTKVDAEVLVFYNLGVGVIKSFTGFDGTDPVTKTEIDCSTGVAPISPTGGFTASVVYGSNVTSFGVWGANPPLYGADLSAGVPAAIEDIFANVALPNPTNDVLICYDQGMEVSPGISYKAIPRKFSTVDHYVRQRPENSLTLNDLFVLNSQGVQRISGRLCTIIVKVMPNGIGIPSEIQYYCGCMMQPKPMNSGSGGNDSVGISLQGSYNFSAIFTATPP